MIRCLVFFFIIWSLIGCNQNSRDSDLLHKQAQLLNEGMEQLLIDQLSMLTAEAAEHPYGIKPYYKDARFYYDNTYFLINGDSKQPDSLTIWRLTETKQANKYGFTPELDSSLVFGNDSIMRTSALLLNLYNYVNALSRYISICGMDYGLYPEWDKTASTPRINIYGDPEGTIITGLVMGANISVYTKDTMPLLGTLILADIVDTNYRPMGK